MKNTLFLLITLMALSTSCTKDDNSMTSDQEITTIDSISHAEATEMLRLNILSEYGGVFRQFELYHAEVFDIGLPCDSIVDVTLTDSNDPIYDLNIPLEVNTSCRDAWGVYNNRFYKAYQREGIQITSSEIFSIEVRLNEKQTIAGNFEDNIYTYNQNGRRDILITEGISPELDPVAELILHFPNCQYDLTKVVITEITKPTFILNFRTNEGSPTPSTSIKFEGEIQLIDSKWTVTYDDGVVDFL